MSRTLERLIYESSATGSTGSLLNLAAILAEAQRNNDRDDLTGALAAHDERYIQVIEGPASALDNLLRRLERDPRHRNIVILERAPIAARAFGQWAMASARITPELAPVLDAVMSTSRPSAAQLVEALKRALDPGARMTV